MVIYPSPSLVFGGRVQFVNGDFGPEDGTWLVPSCLFTLRMLVKHCNLLSRKRLIFGYRICDIFPDAEFCPSTESLVLDVINLAEMKHSKVFMANVARKQAMTSMTRVTLQGINISYLGKRKIIFKSAFLWDMFVPRRVL